jgi:hypothetical protein
LNRGAIAILGVLNNEDHQKRDDCRPSIDNELPRIGVMEYRAGNGPSDDDEYREQKSNRPPRLMGGSSRDVGEDVLHLRRTHRDGTLFPNVTLAAPIFFGLSRLTAGDFGFLTFTNAQNVPSSVAGADPYRLPQKRERLRGFVGYQTMIEGPLVFFAALVTATVGILAALYAIAKDTKPHRGGAHYRRVRFWSFR